MRGEFGFILTRVGGLKGDVDRGMGYGIGE